MTQVYTVIHVFIGLSTLAKLRLIDILPSGGFLYFMVKFCYETKTLKC